MIYRTAESRAVLKERCLEAKCCESCGRPPRSGTRLEWHHCFLRVGGGAGDHIIGGIVVDRLCHHEAESSTQANARLKEIIAKRERTTVEAIERALWTIRRIPKGSSEARIATMLEELPTEPRRLALTCLRESGAISGAFTGATEQ